jgi:hypothetical protein
VGENPVLCVGVETNYLSKKEGCFYCRKESFKYA